MSAADRSIPWRPLLPGVLLALALLWLLRDTVAAMVGIWASSETFTHAFLVPPISVWLIWRRRFDLANQPIRPRPWLLIPVALMSFGWLLAELAAVGVVAHFALVTLLVLIVPVVYGWAVARAITFPLLFLYFAVPFGLFAAPQMMEWTADFTVLALRATGIPVYRDGMDFVIPSGNWSVVEACSGVRYLIASFMVGTLFAHLNYRSTRRRAVFILLSLIVPLIANWLRAYMIVMIGHLSNNELAVGVDHLIYGWVFFGVVIGLLFFFGARWSEPDPEVKAPALVKGTTLNRSFGRTWISAVGVLVLVLATQAWAWRLDHAQLMPAPAIQLPVGASGWLAAEEPLPWPPGFLNPGAVAERAYAQGDQRVWLWVGYYRQQRDHSKMVSSVNRLIPAGNRLWSQTETGQRDAESGLPGFRTAVLRQGGALGTAQRLRIWRIYWIGGHWTDSDVLGKAWQAYGRLLGRGDDGAVVLLATPHTEDADRTLAHFARDHLAPIDAALASARDLPYKLSPDNEGP